MIIRIKNNAEPNFVIYDRETCCHKMDNLLKCGIAKIVVEQNGNTYVTFNYPKETLEYGFWHCPFCKTEFKLIRLDHDLFDLDEQEEGEDEED